MVIDLHNLGDRGTHENLLLHFSKHTVKEAKIKFKWKSRLATLLVQSLISDKKQSLHSMIAWTLAIYLFTIIYNERNITFVGLLKNRSSCVEFSNSLSRTGAVQDVLALVYRSIRQYNHSSYKMFSHHHTITIEAFYV